MKKIFISTYIIILSVVTLNAQEPDIDDYDFHSESRENTNGNFLPRIKGAKVSYGVNYSLLDFSTYANQYSTVFGVNSLHNASGLGLELWTKPIGFAYRRFQLSEVTYLGVGENLTLNGEISSIGLMKALYYKRKRFFTALELSYQTSKFEYFVSNSTVSNAQNLFSGTYNSSRITERRTELRIALLNHLTIPKIGRKLQGIALNVNPIFNIPLQASSFESLGVNLSDIESSQNPYFSMDVSLAISFLKKRRKSSSKFKF